MRKKRASLTFQPTQIASNDHIMQLARKPWCAIRHVSVAPAVQHLGRRCPLKVVHLPPYGRAKLVHRLNDDFAYVTRDEDVIFLIIRLLKNTHT